MIVPCRNDAKANTARQRREDDREARSGQSLPSVRSGMIVGAAALAVLTLILARTGVVGQDATPTDDPSVASKRNFTEEFYLDQCKWASTGSNLFFRLDPGFRLVLRGEADGKSAEVVITVLDRTEKVGNVQTRVIEEREKENGELVEVSRNYFALCTTTGSVFYFGEEVDDYENGQIVGHDGSWRADRGQNRPGLIMPGQPLLGARFFQEIAPDVALDRSEIIALGLRVDTPAGRFTGCFRAVDTTPLEPQVRDEKVYCPEVGLVRDETLRLVQYGPADRRAPA